MDIGEQPLQRSKLRKRNIWGPGKIGSTRKSTEGMSQDDSCATGLQSDQSKLQQEDGGLQEDIIWE